MTNLDARVYSVEDMNGEDNHDPESEPVPERQTIRRKLASDDKTTGFMKLSKQRQPKSVKRVRLFKTTDVWERAKPTEDKPVSGSEPAEGIHTTPRKRANR